MHSFVCACERVFIDVWCVGKLECAVTLQRIPYSMDSRHLSNEDT